MGQQPFPIRIMHGTILVVLVVLSGLHDGSTRTLRNGRSLYHFPPLGVPTFRRDSVESLPRITEDEFAERAASLRDSFFGSRSLPLRTAVESVPPKLTFRIPLRDAVEKRPAPDESYRAYTSEEFDAWYQSPWTKKYEDDTVPNTGFPTNIYQRPLQSATPYSSGHVFMSLFGPPLQLPYTPRYTGHRSHQQLVIPNRYRFARQSPDFDGKQILSPYYAENNKEQKYKLVCYIEGWAAYRKEPLSFTPQELDPHACTHVIYAFATLDPHSFTITPQDSEYDVVRGGYRSATGLKRKNPDLKVLISVGGGPDQNAKKFSQMVASAARRQDFIQSAITFLTKFGFDGVDFHWQYPASEEVGGHLRDKDHFVQLLEEVNETFKQYQWIISVGVPASRFRIEDGFNLVRIAQEVHFLTLQAYDFHLERQLNADHHSPLLQREHDRGLDIFYNADFATRYILKKGVPRTKLIMGIPMYGRSFTLSYQNTTEPGSAIKGPGKEGYYTQTPGLLAYYEVCEKLQSNGWNNQRDSVGAPYAVYGDQWVGYEDKDSVRNKVLYIKELGLGGAMAWAVDMDDFQGLCGDKWPLLNTIRESLQGDDSEDVSSNIPVKPVGTCFSDGLYSDPSDCSAYYICRGGLSYHLACKSNMLFDIKSGQCNYGGAEQCLPGQSVLVRSGIKDEKKVVCYVTNWAFYRKAEGKFVPEHLDHRLCTHIVYAFASLEPEQLMIQEFDPWADLDNNLYDRITSRPDATVLLALGGWTDSSGDKYSRLVSDGAARRKFVIGVVSFLRKHGFKGLHIDWNYPKCWQSNCSKGHASDKPNFTKLIQELRKEFNKESPPFVLAAAISGYKEVIDVGYELAPLGQALDFMSVMTYDYHGSWEQRTGHVSPLYERPGDKYTQYNSNYTMEYLVSKGAPREKLLLGLPFYGQSFTLARHDGDYSVGAKTAGPGDAGEFTKQPGMLSYFEICYRIKNNRWSVTQDPYQATGPFAHSRDQWVGFEDPKSISEKVKYIMQHGFGGAIAWTVDLDDFLNRCCLETFPLLKAINRGLGRLAEAAPNAGDCTRPPAPVTPIAPILTTGVDTGALSSTTHMHEHFTEKPTDKPTTWPAWSSSKKPTTGMTTSSPWWVPDVTSTTTKRTTTVSSTTRQPTTTPKPTTTKKPTTTTQKTTTSWWQPSESTTIPTPAVVMPEVDLESPTLGSCETGQYLPDPQNCNAYYRCILGEMKKQYCAGGLHWNKRAHVCDWPTEARCADKDPSKPSKPTTQRVTTTRRTTTPRTTTVRWPTTTTRRSTTRQATTQRTTTTTRRTTKLPITTQRTTTKRPTTSKPAQSCNTGQYYSHDQCTSFYVCVNGVLISQKCGPGLVWSQSSAMCDWEHKVKCIAKKKTPVNAGFTTKHQPEGPCDGGSFAPYPGNCGQYLMCLWGKYQEFSCAPGLIWNDERKICDWPGKARCAAADVPEEGEEWKPPTTIKPITTSFQTSTGITQSTTQKITTTTESSPLSGEYKIVCYFTNWAWYRRGLGKYTPDHIDTNLCTHIVYGFAVLDYENLVIKAHDSWADFDNKFYQRVTAYKAKGVKVSLALGGWNDSAGDKYSRLVNSPAARSRFIKHALAFLEKHDFDGLDLDWEYPKCWQVNCDKGPDSDKQAFAAFVRELHAAFAPKGLLLSAAVSPSKTVVDAGYDVPALAASLDWVAVMTYDFHGQWDKQTGHVAPLYYHPDDSVPFFNANYSLNYWMSEGVPRSKIIMGMPLYGQSFQLETAQKNGLNSKAPGPGQSGEFTRAAGFLAYYEICDRVKNRGWTVVQDPKHRMGPYAYKGNQWVSYDDVAMIRRKSHFIKKMGLGGGMIWALDLDDFRNRCGEGVHPLLTTIRDVLYGDEEFNEPEVPEENEEDENVEATTKKTTKKPVVTPHITHKPSSTIDMKEPLKVTTEIPMVEETPKPQTITDPNSEYKMVCYFTNWAWYRQGKGKYVPADIDPDLCTHVVYGFAVLNGDQLIIKPHDSWADYDNKFYAKVTELKNKGVKVLIAIGGWNDSAGDKYSRLVNNPAARRRFIAHVINFIEENNFDGLDLDWEYPKCWQVDCKKGPDSDKSAFAEFVTELRAAFNPKNLLLSAAVSPSKKVVESGYDVPTLSRDLDWIAVMAYDYHGQWDKITGHVAPMYGHPEDKDATFNTNFTIHYWIEQGADRKKLVLGMPLYGQSFSLADNNKNGLNSPTYGGGEAGEETRARGFLAYYEICHNIKNRGWKVVRDPRGRMGPYAYLRDQWVSFDDSHMLEHKSQYIKAMGLGGGMVWALDLDDFRNTCGCEPYPLLRTINRVLRDYPGPQPNCPLEIEDQSQKTTVKPPKKPTESYAPPKPQKPTTEKPSTSKPWTQKPSTSKPWTQKPSTPKPVTSPKPITTTKPSDASICTGKLFVEHDSDCNKYYLCNYGLLQEQKCPNGLYWNKDHCDWPENSDCQSNVIPGNEQYPNPVTSTKKPFESTTKRPSVTTSSITTKPTKPLHPGIKSDYKVVCYFTNWAWYRQGDGKYTPGDIDPSLCTHITYGFAVLDPNTLTMKPHDSWADIDNSFYDKVTAFREMGIKVLIALGGWNDSLGNKYSRLVNDASARARFITHAVQFIEKWSFDGLDLDWEYPKCWQVDCEKGPASDKSGFAALVSELSAQFRPRGWLLSAAVSPSKAVIDAGYDVPSLSKHFDWIAVMTYDFHGHWDKQTGHVAPLYYYPGDTYDYFNANFSLNYWIEKGAPASKIIMGMPLYGQSFSLANDNERGLNAKSYGPGEAGEYTRAGGFLAFYEICERVKMRDWTVTRDAEGRIGPYAHKGNQWVSYDDIEEIKRKSNLVKDLRLGGGMIWALDLDDFRNRCGCGKHPLLKTMNHVLRGISIDTELRDCT